MPSFLRSFNYFLNFQQIVKQFKQFFLVFSPPLFFFLFVFRTLFAPLLSVYIQMIYCPEILLEPCSHWTLKLTFRSIFSPCKGELQIIAQLKKKQQQQKIPQYNIHTLGLGICAHVLEYLGHYLPIDNSYPKGGGSKEDCFPGHFCNWRKLDWEKQWRFSIQIQLEIHTAPVLNVISLGFFWDDKRHQRTWAVL